MTDPVIVLGLTGLALLAWIAMSAAGAVALGDWLLSRGVSMPVAERVEQITWTLATVAGMAIAIGIAAA